MSEIRVVDEHSKRKFSTFVTDNGVVLCDNQSGAFLTLRYTEDLENLREMLDKITIIKGYDDDQADNNKHHPV